jgi:hypothetical protein
MNYRTLNCLPLSVLWRTFLINGLAPFRSWVDFLIDSAVPWLRQLVTDHSLQRLGFDIHIDFWYFPRNFYTFLSHVAQISGSVFIYLFTFDVGYGIRLLL